MYKVKLVQLVSKAASYSWSGSPTVRLPGTVELALRYAQEATRVEPCVVCRAKSDRESTPFRPETFCGSCLVYKADLTVEEWQREVSIPWTDPDLQAYLEQVAWSVLHSRARSQQSYSTNGFRSVAERVQELRQQGLSWQECCHTLRLAPVDPEEAEAARAVGRTVTIKRDW